MFQQTIRPKADTLKLVSAPTPTIYFNSFNAHNRKQRNSASSIMSRSHHARAPIHKNSKQQLARAYHPRIKLYPQTQTPKHLHSQPLTLLLTHTHSTRAHTNPKTLMKYLIGKQIIAYRGTHMVSLRKVRLFCLFCFFLCQLSVPLLRHMQVGLAI
jgi:hypothetical protein